MPLINRTQVPLILWRVQKSANKRPSGLTPYTVGSSDYGYFYFPRDWMLVHCNITPQYKILLYPFIYLGPVSPRFRTQKTVAKSHTLWLRLRAVLWQCKYKTNSDLTRNLTRSFRRMRLSVFKYRSTKTCGSETFPGLSRNGSLGGRSHCGSECYKRYLHALSLYVCRCIKWLTFSFLLSSQEVVK